MATRIEDAGKKIGGARKDWRAAHMTVADVATMTLEEKADLIKKDNIWPKPDYEALVEGGMPINVAAAVKIIRDRMAATPTLKQAASQEQGRIAYVKMVAAVRDQLLSCRSIEEINGTYRQLMNSFGGETATRRDPEVLPVWNSVYKDRFAPFQFDTSDRMKAQEMIVAGFPSDMPAWKKGVKFYKTGDGRLAAFKSGRPLGTFATKDDAFEFLRLKLEAAAAKKKEGPKPAKLPPTRPHLDELVREGMTDHRNGRNVTPEQFLDVFGFQGVEFGNWVPHDERQSMLNLGFDGMMDLAEILGWNERDMSLGGRLSAAFGARGQGGRAAAHYESGQAVYNFTRFSGAGSQAHEFAHGLDHLLGLGTTVLSESGIPSATGWRHMPPMPTTDVLAHRGPEIAGAWDAVISAIHSTPMLKGEAVSIQKKRVDAFTRAIARQEIEYNVALEEGRNSSARATARDIATNTERLGVQTKRLELLVAKDEFANFGRVQSAFKTEAERMTGASGYESRPNELFARAFESFVFDELESRGALSQYLVHGVEEDRYADKDLWKGNPYPTGTERESLKFLFAEAARKTITMMDDLRNFETVMALGR